MNPPKSTSGPRRLLWNLLRLAVTVGAIWYVVTQINWQDRLIAHGQVAYGWARIEDGKRVLVGPQGERLEIPAGADHPDSPVRFVPGIVSLFRQVKFGYLALAIVLYPLTIAMGGIRWLWLLQSHGLHPGIWETFRLTWMGFLSNNILPGATGGDLVKAVCISRRTPGKRTSAVMTVLLDRIVGLVALILIGAVAVLIKSGRNGLDAPGRLVLIMLATAAAAGMIFFSRRARKLLFIDEILARIPFGEQIRKIDQSLFHYKDHKWQLTKCVLLSIVIHLFTLGLVVLLGQSLSMKVPVLDYYVFLPLIFTAGAVAPSIAGLGVLEGLFQHFFGLAGASAASAVALCLLYRLMMLIASIPGAWPLYVEFSERPKQLLSEETLFNGEEAEPLKTAMSS